MYLKKLLSLLIIFITSSTLFAQCPDPDETDPTMICQDITVELDANGEVTISPSQLDNGSFDDCGIVLLQSTTDFDCDDLGANTVRLFGFDNLDLAIANIGFCDAIVTVVDNLPPSIADMPSSESYTVVSGTCGAVATWTEPTASDNAYNNIIDDPCTGLTLTSDYASGDTFPLGATLVTYTATDGSGNETEASFTVTVTDNEAPVVTGSITASTVEGCDANDAPAAVTTVAALEALTGDLAIADACTADGDLIVASSDASAGTCPVVVTRTYTVKDASDNTSVNIVHTINVDDTTAPVVTGSITASTVEGCDANDAPAAVTTVAALEALTGDLAIADACTADGDLIVASSDASAGTCPLVITRTYTVKDACDNTSVNIVHTINVDDTTAPVVTGSITASTVEGCDASVAPAAVTTVAALEALTGDLAIADACTADGDLIVASSDASAGTCPVVITRTYTVKDACDNTSVNIVHTINVDDTTAPVVTGSITASTVEGCDASVAPAAVTTVAALEALTGDLAIADACTADGDLIVASSDASAGTCPLVITRTYTVKDACDNTSVNIVHTINVDDTTAPVVTGSITASTVEGCDANDAPAAVTTVAALEALTGDLAIADACTADGDLIVASSDASSGTCPLVITRTYTVKDACDNTSVNIVHTINVDDTTAPVVTGSITASTVEGCDANDAPAAVTTVAALEALTGDLAIADACTADGDLIVASSDASAGTCPVVVTRTYTVKDACDNTSVNIVHTINVDDTTAPVVTGSITASTVEGCDASVAPAAVTTVAALEALTGDLAIADACTADGDLIVASSDASSGTCPLVITRTYTVKDACDNTSVNIVHTINVDDTTAPVVTGSITASTVEGCDANDAPAAVTTVAALEALTGDLAIADACTADGDLIVASSDASAGTCPVVVTRTYTVKDACDNTSVNIVHTINVDDTTAPVVTGSITASTVEGCDANDAPAAVTTVAALEALTGDLAIADACTADGDLIVASSDASAGTCPLVITRTYTVKDACDNTSVNIVHTINVDDTTAPVVTGSITASTVEGCDASVAPAAVTTVAALEALTGDLAIADACTADGDLIVASSDASAGTCPVVITRTYTVKDACDNTSVNIVHTINVDDTTAPVVTGSITASTVEGCDASVAPAAVTTVAALEALTGDLAIADACTADGDLIVASSDASAGTCPLVITRTYTVKDACDNTSVNIVHTINVDDTTAPVVTGSITASTVEGCDANDAPAAVTTVAALEALTGDLAIADACTADGDLIVASSDASSGTCPLVITRTYTVKDACDNTSVNIVHTINVDDTTAPVVTGSITASTVEGCDANDAPAAVTTVAALEALTGDLAIADACTADGDLIVASSDASAGTCPLVITRTYTVKDACDNTSVNIVHTINVDDTTAPVVTGSITASTVEGCDASVAPAAVTTVAALEALTGDLAIADACTADGDLIVASSDASAGTCPLVITRTYTVKDACDNTSVNIVHTINVDDTTAPVVTGSITASTVEGCDASVAPAAVTTVAALEALTGDLAIADACTADGDLIVASSDASSGTCPVVITRTYTVKDACDNTSVNIVHTINVDDTTAPVVTGSITASTVEGCDANDAPAAVTTVAALEALTGDLAIADACTADGDLIVASSDASAGTCPLVITRTYTVKDACDNTSVNIVHTINVDDTTAPVVTGSITASTVEGCDASVAPAAVTTVAALEALTGDLAIADACTADGDLIVASSDASAGTCPLVITRTYTVKDACDNTSVNIVHTINVDDTTAPVVTGSITASTVEGCDASVAPAAVTTVAALEALTGDLAIADACTADGDLIVASSDASAGTCPVVITRTYTVKDACDNTSVNIVHTINVDDTTAPVVTGSITASTVEGCDASVAPAAVTTVAALEALTGDLAIADACTADGDLIVASSDASAGTCPLVITRTYTVKDACDNTSVNIVHTINVDDTTAPVVTGSITASTVEGCDANDAPAAVTTVAALEALTGDLERCRRLYSCSNLYCSSRDR
jgi:hypothetical protein